MNKNNGKKIYCEEIGETLIVGDGPWEIKYHDGSSIQGLYIDEVNALERTEGILMYKGRALSTEELEGMGTGKCRE